MFQNLENYKAKSIILRIEKWYDKLKAIEVQEDISPKLEQIQRWKKEEEWKINCYGESSSWMLVAEWEEKNGE